MKTTLRSNAVRSLFNSSASNSSAETAATPGDLLDGLVRRAAHGDRNAIAALARSFRPQLVAEARKHLQLADAEDIVQDVFVLLLEGTLRPPRTRERAVPWLLRTVCSIAEEQAR
jgi:hypothetical protein